MTLELRFVRKGGRVLVPGQALREKKSRRETVAEGKRERERERRCEDVKKRNKERRYVKMRRCQDEKMRR